MLIENNLNYKQSSPDTFPHETKNDFSVFSEISTTFGAVGTKNKTNILKSVLN